MKVAIIHDWLTVYAGAERVLEQLIQIWPDADLFSVVDFVPEAERGFLQGKRAKTTFIQRMPLARTKYRNYLPLMPIAIEQLDLSAYELVVSSSHAVAKGVITGPDQVHVSYVHSPMRYAWDLQHQYLKEARLDQGVKSVVARSMLHYMRLWDLRTSNGVDQFVANSSFIARRIAKAYRRDAVVVYPPVSVERLEWTDQKEDFYVTASRMVPYKKIPMIVEAFSRMRDKKLVVIGDGPELARVRELATPNVSVLGFQPTEVLVDYIKRARAFVFAAEEDFGIAPVEAQACGTPVIAYGKGGVLESIVGVGDGARTGLFYPSQTPEAVVEAVKAFEKPGFDISSKACRENSLRFSETSFRRTLSDIAALAIQEKLQPVARNGF
ncbi:glycosyltransferase family 4 protein [Nitrogeniibacter aestuarii]|uniref:glycosyltransferase family 4 protein n=1 Tax=Nitrogeniibacter aestuarii TaxID=2815343 RepID=UPI001E45B63B|nr:glycosyltransferase family 4 protein [Nitrogeniibacter aestuarii]